jgi:putative glutathione S-transferase
MASLIDGKISPDPIAKTSRSGEFLRPDSIFRGQISANEAEPHRYHLYVSYACPWAHRTLIMRGLKGLKPLIDISVTDPLMGEKGWTFSDARDPKYLAVLYVASNKRYTGKVTVPVLWDRKKKSIVNNESSEIIRIFNSAFDELTGNDLDFYPEELRADIDEINKMVYEKINNGVYKCGFASSQRAYDKNFQELFSALDEVEVILSMQPFLVGDKITEADIRLFTTLLRFDPVYYGHFKCNLRQIREYKHLYQYMKSIYQLPEVKETCHFDHIKNHYYLSHKWINPTGIVPRGPDLSDLDLPHDRGRIQFHHKDQTNLKITADPSREPRPHSIL